MNGLVGVAIVVDRPTENRTVLNLKRIPFQFNTIARIHGLAAKGPSERTSAPPA